MGPINVPAVNSQTLGQHLQSRTNPGFLGHLVTANFLKLFPSSFILYLVYIANFYCFLCMCVCGGEVEGKVFIAKMLYLFLSESVCCVIIVIILLFE